MDKFIIQPEKDIKKELARIMLSQVLLVHEMTCDKSEGINKNVHEIRKRFKMIRSVLRIIRDSAGYSFYYRENIRFRDMARKLSPARDKQVLLENAISLTEKLPDLKNEERYRVILKDLTHQRDEALRQLLIAEDVCSHLRSSLESAIPEIKNVSFQNSGFDVIEGGLRRMYRQARNNLSKVRENKNDQIAIHTLRKRVKYLWYQIQMLAPLYPLGMEALERSLDNISDDLGIHRDSYLFRGFLEKNNHFELNKNQSSEIQKILNDQMESRLSSAIDAATKFYLEKPEIFTNRISSWYEISKQA